MITITIRRLCTLFLCLFVTTYIFMAFNLPNNAFATTTITSSTPLPQSLSKSTTFVTHQPPLSTSDNKRIIELESELSVWSNLLAQARRDIDLQHHVSQDKIKRLEEKLHKKELQSRRSTAKLLSKLASSSSSTSTSTSFSSEVDANNPSPLDPSGNTLPSLLIYVYEMPPEFNTDLSDVEPNCKWNAPYSWQTKYTLETYMHAMLLKSPLRTLDPEAAHLFYVPIYVGCHLHHIGTNFNKASTKILQGVKWIQNKYPYWKRTQGRDHIFTFTHDIGGCVAPFRDLKHAIFITNTGELRDRSAAYKTYTNMYTKGYYQNRDLTLPCFNPWKDIVAPPMINDIDMIHWHETVQKDSALKLPRDKLATFRGTIIDKPGGWHYYSRGIRQHWLSKYEFDQQIKVTAVHPKEGFGDKAANYQKTYRNDFLTSTYCLCPPGWATWTPRLYEALLLGCIPAIIADDNVLPFSRTLDYTRFAVHVPESKANSLIEVLPQGKERISELQNGVEQVYKAFVYNDPPIKGDAFHYLMRDLEWRAKSLGVMAGIAKDEGI